MIFGFMIVSFFPSDTNAEVRRKTAIEGAGIPGQVAIWESPKSVTGYSYFTWDSLLSRLGIGVSKPTATLDLKANTATAFNLLNYYDGVETNVYGVRSAVYSNQNNADVYGAYLTSSSDASVRRSYGLYARSVPENAELSVGVYGQGDSYGVHGVGPIAVFGENNSGGIAVKAKQTQPTGYAFYAEGGRNYFGGPVEIGSPEKPTGITIYDEVTGAPNCIKIADGEFYAHNGKCAGL